MVQIGFGVQGLRIRGLRVSGFEAVGGLRDFIDYPSPRPKDMPFLEIGILRRVEFGDRACFPKPSTP